MVSTGKGEVGAAKLTNEVLQIIEKLPHVIEGLTGVNLISQVSHHSSAKNEQKWPSCIKNLSVNQYLLLSFGHHVMFEYFGYFCCNDFTTSGKILILNIYRIFFSVVLFV